MANNGNAGPSIAALPASGTLQRIFQAGEHPIPKQVSIRHLELRADAAPYTAMKHTRKILPLFLVLGAIQFASTGCVGGGGDGGVYYGGAPWVDNDVIVTGGGRGWFGGNDAGHRDGGYVHPSGGGHTDAHAGSGGHPSGGGDSHPSGGDSHPSGGGDHNDTGHK